MWLLPSRLVSWEDARFSKQIDVENFQLTVWPVKQGQDPLYVVCCFVCLLIQLTPDNSNLQGKSVKVRVIWSTGYQEQDYKENYLMGN